MIMKRCFNDENQDSYCCNKLIPLNKNIFNTKEENKNE